MSATMAEVLQDIGRKHGFSDAAIADMLIAVRINFPGQADRELSLMEEIKFRNECARLLKSEDPRECRGFVDKQIKGN